jgi:hypothetical protein
MAAITPAEKSPGSQQAFRLSSDHQPIDDTRIIWEAHGEQLRAGSPFVLQNSATQAWIEAEAVLPDGWFVFGRTNRQPPSGSVARTKPVNN